MRGGLFRIGVLAALASAVLVGSASAAAPPPTIPAVRHWQTRPGPAYRLGERTRIVLGHGPPSLRTSARVLVRDLERQDGIRPATVVGRRHAMRPGDIRINVNRRRAGGVGRQGYRMLIGRTIRIRGGGGDGAFYGTRTLLQLLGGGRSVARGRIRDAPSYVERGLMIDAGRKYFTPHWFAQELRELAWLKLDFIHLHLSDDQGFRIASDSHSEVVSDRYLSKRQMRRIIRIAARYRIEVIPEIDMPGHLTQALSQHPGLQLEDILGRRQPDKLDITNPDARAFALELIREYLPLFPGRYWDMGADEFLGIAPVPEGVPNPAYAEYPQIEQYAKRRYGPDADAHDAVDGFIEQVRRLVERHGKTLRIWHDGLDLKDPGAVTVDPDVVVDWWIDLEGPSPQELVEAGHKITNAGWFPTYYVQGPLSTVRPNMGAAYEGWDPTSFYGPLVCNAILKEPADTLPAADPGLLGTSLNVWNDDPNAQTEREIARDIAMRLRVIAQQGWGSPKPTPGYDGFLKLADEVGYAPGYDELDRPPSTSDGRDCTG